MKILSVGDSVSVFFHKCTFLEMFSADFNNFGIYSVTDEEKVLALL